ncbi:hypothetical protein [Bacillus sp. UMB0728]|uniref:hypothetical protein n=1 Tax=Bacillus sp. UMB0728 TaxID=2066052 RepID=UPI000C78430E|nr:hypothetical protein [Bacillus sp. UMB0728]PLR70579.1 hypothetical protein CYJ37_23915 [Bacillus sp. UMB0728]
MRKHIIIFILPTAILIFILFLARIFSLEYPVFYLNVGTKNGGVNLFFNLGLLFLIPFLLIATIIFFKRGKLNFILLLLGTIFSILFLWVINWLLLIISFNQQLGN